MTAASPLAVITATITTARHIELRGVRVHNLRQIDLDLPLGQLVVLSGVSGSGKSSLAFDTVFAEGQRRYIESFSASARQYLERIERPNADRIAHVPPAIAIRTEVTPSQSSVASLAEIDVVLRRLFSRIGHVICPDCACEVRSQTVADVVRVARELAAGTRFQLCFAPTADEGAIDLATWRARGFSKMIVEGRSQSWEDVSGNIDPKTIWVVVDRLVSDKATSERIAESAETAFREGNGRCVMLVEAHDTTIASSLRSVDDRTWRVHRLSRHWECPTCSRTFLPPEPRLFEPDFGGGCVCRTSTNRATTTAEATAPSTDEGCLICRGTRLSPAALAVRIGTLSIADFMSLTVDNALVQCQDFSQQLPQSELSTSQRLREDLERRLQIVLDLGLGHLTLLRPGQTLSGGQMRRLMLAAAIGSRITGTLCLIDEPSAGLFPDEVPLVLQALRRLLEQRNSIVVVDHDPQVIRAADHIVDLGPGAGPQGGAIVYQGSPAQLATVEQSATARALRHEAFSSKTRSQRSPSDWLTLKNVRHRNLRGLTVRLPLGVLCVVSGRGGSGKSSLVTESLVPTLRNRLGVSPKPAHVEAISGGDLLVDVAVIDREPLTRSKRSNAATWLDVFDEIRDVFAMTADAKQRGFGSQHFSFNAAQGGRCLACRGTGVLRHDMQFLPDVTLTCPECHGTRYRREVLDIKYRGRSIADVLAMSASEAAIFFRNHPKLQVRLQMLKQIGLDYLVLGQPTETLSGGEAQRLKLASRLTSSRGPTLIVCEEPTNGLHPADVAKLVACFDELLGIGHSIIVIENNRDLLQAADHVIELGLATGAEGSHIVSEGPPLQSARSS